MPLTIAHPIAAAPIWYLTGKRLDLPALCVGAMVPDIMYFLYLRPAQNIGHAPEGIFLQGLPFALVILAIYFSLMNAPLRALFPRSLGRILPETYAFFPAKRLAVIALSAVIGSTSHVLWDSFTHTDRYFTDLFPQLHTLVGPLPIYKYLQYSGGVLGVIGLAVWAAIAAKARPAPKQAIASKTVPVILICLPIALTLIAALLKKAPLTSHQILVQGTIGVIAGTWLGVLFFGLIDRVFPFKRAGRPTKP